MPVGIEQRRQQYIQHDQRAIAYQWFRGKDTTEKSAAIKKRFLCCWLLTPIHTCDGTSDVLAKSCMTLATLQRDQSNSALSSSPFAVPLPHLLPLSNAHTQAGRRGSLRRGAASKLRCTHGRAGTRKTKRNTQAHFWLQRITRFTQPASPSGKRLMWSETG